jgi:hypothetical protein
MPTLASLPRLAAEFDRKRNAPLRPADVTLDSRRPIWWRCRVAAAHKWQASPYRRRANRCPFCKDDRPSRARSLAAAMPAAARQWDAERNGKLTPADVTAGSGRRVWWRCPKAPDHRWRTPVQVRGLTGRGCPFCSGRAVCRSNSLAFLKPAIAREWDRKRNGAVTPWDVRPGSGRRVWWRCRKDSRHVWHTSIKSRASNGRGCPFCAGHMVFDGHSLGDRFSEAAALWHPDRNGPLTAWDVTPFSSRRVWWKCPKGPDHEWEGSIRKRARAKVSCPFCASDRISITNCLATRFPAVAHTWHPTLNRATTPRDVTAFTAKKFWWICTRGHAWRAAVGSRTNMRSGCPFCSGRRKVATVRRPRRWVHLPSDYS